MPTARQPISSGVEYRFISGIAPPDSSVSHLHEMPVSESSYRSNMSLPLQENDVTTHCSAAEENAPSAEPGFAGAQ